MIKEERKQMTIDMCRGKRVLHLGCTDWPFTKEKIANRELLHAMIADVAMDLVGVDICQEGLELMRAVNPEWKLVKADAGDYRPDSPCDLVVASEIIEHLENPGQMLHGIASWAPPGTHLLITTNNSQSLKTALRAIVGKEECHPDHTLLFSTATLTQLLNRTGWESLTVQYYRVPAQRLITKIASGMIRILELFASPRMREGLVVLARRRPVTALASATVSSYELSLGSQT